MKKCWIFIILLIGFSYAAVYSQEGVSIGKKGQAPDPSAELEIFSTSKGILIPRLTSLQREAMQPASTANGLLVYDTTTNSFWYYNGSIWNEIGQAQEITTYQQLSFDTLSNLLSLENGGTIDLSSLDQSNVSTDDADADPQNEIELPDYSAAANMVLRVRPDNSGVEWYTFPAISESDPVYSAAPASGITATNIANWSTAFSWGDHSASGYLTSFTESDPVYSAAPASGITATNITNWSTAFSWGDHSTAGYLTSFTESDPVYSAAPASGITATNIANWSTAFSWGNHSAAGYLTSFTESDPVYTAAPASGITATNISNWSTAFSWGDHSTAGYLTSFTESDPVYSAAPASGITAANITNWSNAFSWGDHSTAGYLTSELDGDATNELEMPAAPVAGDLAYYNGTNWARLPKGTEGQVLIIESGTPTWKITAASGSHYVGELFGGGIIFYVYFDPNDGQQHGLIVSLDNLDDGALGHSWSDVNEVVGSISTFDGSANTSSILGSSATTSAALKIQSTYGAGWYLPSIWELQILFNNAFLINQILVNDGDPNTDGILGQSYWSSTEKDLNNAWRIEMEGMNSYGYPLHNAKISNYYVRAIKAF